MDDELYQKSNWYTLVYNKGPITKPFCVVKLKDRLSPASTISSS